MQHFSFFQRRSTTGLTTSSFPDYQSVQRDTSEVSSDEGNLKIKTLLENYWYNAFMTIFQDLPQTIATVVVMTTVGLKITPDNPTGVSLPGYLNLIPQFGNSAAGLAAAYEAYCLACCCKTHFNLNRFTATFLYTVFSVSTITNGVTNIILTLNEENSNSLSQATTIAALSANFLILGIEELQLSYKICVKNLSFRSHLLDLFHLICSINLMISILTAYLVTFNLISYNAAAYGYLIGTWLGQIPELIHPTFIRVLPLIACMKKSFTSTKTEDSTHSEELECIEEVDILSTLTSSRN